MQAQVTVIVPTYNRAHLVTHAIDSVLTQDYPNLQVLVVDDGSTDGTEAVLTRYDDDARVRVLVRERNGGVAAAKNSGLDALGDDCVYFGILDSDDRFTPGAVRTLVAAFEAADEPLSQVFGWCRDADTGEDTGWAPHRAGPITYEDALCGRFQGEFWQLVRRELLGGLRFDEGAAGNEAMVWWPLLKRAPAGLVDVVVRDYDRSGLDRVNRPAFSAEGARRKMLGYARLLERTGSDMQRLCPERYAFLRLEQAKWAALAGERGAAASALRDAHRAHAGWRSLRVAALMLAPAALARRAYARLYGSAR